jgi:WD40 repeat protein
LYVIHSADRRYADHQVSLENGLILSYDSRVLPTSLSQSSSGKLSAAQPKYTLSAHDGAAGALDINPHIRGCIATGGMDKLVKVWNVSDEESEGVKGRKREISLATSRDLGVVSFSRVGLATSVSDRYRARSLQPGGHPMRSRH